MIAFIETAIAIFIAILIFITAITAVNKQTND